MGKDGWERLVYHQKEVRVKKSKGSGEDGWERLEYHWKEARVKKSEVDGEGWLGKIRIPL